MEKLKLRRHESFAIREGWIEKGLNAVNQYHKLAFSKSDGVKLLGIGSNMVKSLKYWMVAGNVLDEGLKMNQTDFAKALLKYDPYLEDNFSWSLFHYFLTTDKEESPVLYYITNIYKSKYLDKTILFEESKEYFSKDYDFNEKSLMEDINMYFRLYEPDYFSNPEDNIISPLSKLELLENGMDRNTYYKSMIDLEKLNYLVVYYCLQQLFDKSFVVDDLYKLEKSPVFVFNLDKGVIDQYLNIMKQNDLITINKTAGLNTVYLNKKFTLDELFGLYFGGSYDEIH